ncbi:unnamed protein product, partial [Amoebophrya sp. A120]
RHTRKIHRTDFAVFSFEKLNHHGSRVEVHRTSPHRQHTKKDKAEPQEISLARAQ